MVNTRDTHVALNGTIVGEDEKFVTTDGNELAYPGDPSAPAREVINCRCVLMPDVADTERDGNSFHTTADPLREITGSITDSNPEEMCRIIEEATALGVEVIWRHNEIAYSPGLKTGQPGQIHVSPEDSYGAWLHEERHMLDDASD